MSSDVLVLGWETSASEQQARKIAEFSGAEVTLVALATAASSGVEAIRRVVPSSCACAVVAVETLARLAGASDTGMDGLRVLLDRAEHMFVYGFLGTDRHRKILKALSSGRLLDLQPLEASDTTFRVADGPREWCGQLCGLTVGAPDSGRDACFVEGPAAAPPTVLIRAGNKPFLVRLEHGKGDLFFSACRELADLDEKVSDEAGLVPWFSRLVPLMIFLRRALGQGIWRNDQPRACFIIDDPLLKSRYGFLDYRRLLDAVRRKRFSTCIAFIPWNYRRSRGDIAALLAANAGMSSLCVHGCDHTGAEFGTVDFASLCGKARLALERMHAHHRRSGVAFADVMIFPQGVFSSEALRALAACGYLAAVNSDLCPSDAPGALTLRDLLEVAITRFADFPLFSRRYPRDPAEFAFDLFLGKPVLAVEHHGYFRSGYAPLETFVDRLQALDERLEWTDLTTICSRACLTRTARSGDVHVRFYTNRFRLEHHGARPQRYRLFRRHAPDGPLPPVTINSRPWRCRQQGDDIELVLSLNPGDTAEVTISSGPLAPAAVSRPLRSVHGARVLARRLLCEFRDNHVDTSRVLSGIVSGVRTLRSRTKAAGGEDRGQHA